jgi:hypothetical protein
VFRSLLHGEEKLQPRHSRVAPEPLSCCSVTLSHLPRPLLEQGSLHHACPLDVSLRHTHVSLWCCVPLPYFSHTRPQHSELLEGNVQCKFVVHLVTKCLQCRQVYLARRSIPAGTLYGRGSSMLGLCQGYFGHPVLGSARLFITKTNTMIHVPHPMAVIGRPRT